jgi:hypothetical protein
MSPNPSDPRHPWARLTAAARTVRDDRAAAAPYGFATRVAALALAQERRVVSLLERFSFRAIGLASLLAVLGVALNYQALTTGAVVAEVADLDLLHADDAVSIVFDLGQD